MRGRLADAKARLGRPIPSTGAHAYPPLRRSCARGSRPRPARRARCRALPRLRCPLPPHMLPFRFALLAALTTCTPLDTSHTLGYSPSRAPPYTHTLNFWFREHSTPAPPRARAALARNQQHAQRVCPFPLPAQRMRAGPQGTTCPQLPSVASLYRRPTLMMSCPPLLPPCCARFDATTLAGARHHRPPPPPTLSLAAAARVTCCHNMGGRGGGGGVGHQGAGGAGAVLEAQPPDRRTPSSRRGTPALRAHPDLPDSQVPRHTHHLLSFPSHHRPSRPRKSPA